MLYENITITLVSAVVIIGVVVVVVAVVVILIIMAFYIPDCARRTYGMDCKLQCGHCKYDKNCNPVNGSCPEGCKDWYIMEGCSKYIGQSYNW